MKALLPLLLIASAIADTPRRSGFETMSPALQAMQRVDAVNPAMLWVREGQALWAARCASCHGEAQHSMAGVAARYPAFDAALKRPLNLAQRIQQHNAGLEAESDALLSLTAFVALQSRGMPLSPPVDVKLKAYLERGRAMYFQRIGQLNLSCAQCHDERAGLRLGGSLIPQGHPTGYPLYRLEWQGLGSLQRRLRNCATGVRAEAWSEQELVDLELYLVQRAGGMKMDAPAVRP